MAATFTMVLMCLAVLTVAFAMPAAQPSGPQTHENMNTAETSHLFSYGLGGYSRYYSPYGYRSGLGVSFGYGYPSPYSHSYAYSSYPRYLPHF